MPLYDDPPRLRFLKAMTAALQEITPANGYRHDLSSSVFRGRLLYSQKDPLPMVTILEPPIPDDIPASAPTNPEQLARWELLVQGFVKDDPLNPSDPAYRLLADVKRRLASERPRAAGGPFSAPGGGPFGLNGLVTDVEIGQGAVRPNEEVNNTAFFWLLINVRIIENVVNPYGESA